MQAEIFLLSLLKKSKNNNKTMFPFILKIKAN